VNDPLLNRFQAILEGRYTIERELGRGGMATVYLARDLRHGRTVAIKLLQPEIATSLTAERFLREITITAKLQHPNILGLFDSGAEEGLCYYVMPHVEGESLRDRLLWEKQLTVPTAVEIASEICNALSYAHSRGVVHRDIKPENILFSAGHPIVADFGIARAVSEGQKSITAVGIPLGTPPYMSPEQAQGLDHIDHRSDIYALGCVLFEMVAGRPPFVGVSIGKVIQQHLQTPPPSIRDFNPEAPATLDPILQNALAKQPAQRFQKAEEMLDALRLIAATETLERLLPEGAQDRRAAQSTGGGGGAVASQGAAAGVAPGMTREKRLIVLLGALAVIAIAGLVFVLLRG
jgi:eukaryotic-like serine/threonine-protein kinase